MGSASVLVTGATGFIGRHLVARLAADGREVVALARRPSTDAPQGVRCRAGDVTDPSSITGAANGCDAVIHLVGLAHHVTGPPPPEADFMRVNENGTRTLLEEARRAGASRFVYMSSVKAAAERSGDRPLRETDPPAPEDAYGRSKLAAEELVLAAGRDGGLQTAILRPPMVYGPGNRGNLPRLAELVRRGLPLPFGGVGNARSMIFVDNLVDAILRILETPHPTPAIYYVADGAPISTPALLASIGEAVGHPARLLNVPAPLLTAAARAGDLIAALRPVPFNSDVLGKLVGSLVVDDTALRAATGYRPAVGTPEGIARTVREAGGW
jgi:nucleoside-diphosphate-sugar epimerase